VTNSDEPPAVASGSRLSFGSPLSGERAARLAAELAATRPGTVLDLGCGWGELLLRIAAATPGSHGTGVDNHAPDLKRGRANAAERGLAGRVRFVEGPAAEHITGKTADLVLNTGAWHALGGTIPEALNTLRTLVNPGGRLLFAAEYWERPPTDAELGRMWPGISRDDYTDLAGLTDLAVTAGFRPLRIESVTRGEWEDFESGIAADREEWLLTHPGHPRAEEVRAQLDRTRALWLRGHRGILGFAYLTLGVGPAATR
jgi:SAM-dependent methyltransferase